MIARGGVLDSATADRLVKLCGMFGSAHAGERANAAEMADKLIRQLGLTWADVIWVSARRAPASSDNQQWQRPQSWQESVATALAHEYLLTDWEFQFVSSIQNFRSLTDRQQAVLTEIIDKLRAHAA